MDENLILKMKILKKILKYLLISCCMVLCFYLSEAVFFPKNVVEIRSDLIENEELQFLDVNYKLRANKEATGNKLEEQVMWYVSDNEPIEIDGLFKENGVTLLLQTENIIVIDQKYVGNELFLINNSDSSLCLSAQDSRLYLKMQAKNILGLWSDVEYIPNSWCGNSYHETCLDKGKYWKFDSPIFKGRHKTKLRYILEMNGQALLSNEIVGFINYGQFFNKEKYFSNSIMNPYSE